LIQPEIKSLANMARAFTFTMVGLI